VSGKEYSDHDADIPIFLKLACQGVK
jgi:hypothetical protein